jgi:SAM-dependent methyltransferase
METKEMDWTAGDITDIEYIYLYSRELCPGHLRLACLSDGVAFPPTESLTCLELGYGQGLSVNIHAAANSGIVWGTDFNPTHASKALAMAAASGSGANLLDAAFSELAARPDLPEFDIIGLHGIWSWVSDENRRVIVDIIKRKLRVGGVVYISYNCPPGWSAAAPLRDLMALHAEYVGSDASGIIGKVEGALKFAQEVADSGALYFRANPEVAERLKRISRENRNYLAHEYLAYGFEVMSFSEVSKWLSDAKLSFVASANLLDHVDVLNLTPEGQKFLAGIQHSTLRQAVRDYFVNQQFRKDIFIKGPRRLTPLEKLEALRTESLVLTAAPDDVPLKVKGSIGEAVLQEQLYRPFLHVMAERDYTPKKVEELAAHPKLKSMPIGQIMQVVLVLAGAGHIHSANIPSASTRKNCRALNRYICARARSSGEIAYLASPITGGAVSVPRTHQLFILAMQQGKKSEGDMAAFVWNLVANQGVRVSKSGKPLESTEENLAELTELARQFLTKRFPVLKALEAV